MGYLHSPIRRAKRGWTSLYMATFSDPMDITHTLDPAPKGSTPANPIIKKRILPGVFD